MISFVLGSYTAKKSFITQFKKDKYLECHNDVIKFCYGLPNQFLVNYETINNFYNEDVFSKVISSNLIYMDESRIKSWSTFNYALTVYKDPAILMTTKNNILLPLLNYYSASIILETLEESAQTAEELELPKVAKELTLVMADLSFYEQKLPTLQEAREDNLQHLMPQS